LDHQLNSLKDQVNQLQSEKIVLESKLKESFAAQPAVIDLRKRFGDKKVTSTRRNRILVVEHKGRLCGLIVDSASEVLKIPASDVEPSTEVFHEGLNCVTGLAKHQNRLIVLLDMDKLLELKGRRQQGSADANGSTDTLAAAAAQGTL